MKQILVIFIGHPGVGKTHFTKQLAPKLKAVRLNSDHMRTAMFGDDMDKIRDHNNNPMVFGAIDYAMYEALKAGYSVVYDSQHNKKHERQKTAKIAAEFGVPTILVWVKAPTELALKRGTEREDAPDVRRKSEEQMRASIEKFKAALEEPGADEPYITIDGTQSFDVQYYEFISQLYKLLP